MNQEQTKVEDIQKEVSAHWVKILNNSRRFDAACAALTGILASPHLPLDMPREGVITAALGYAQIMIDEFNKS